MSFQMKTQTLFSNFLNIYAKSPVFGGWHLHIGTFTRIFFDGNKIAQQIFLQEEKRKIGYRSIQM